MTRTLMVFALLETLRDDEIHGFQNMIRLSSATCQIKVSL